MPSDLQISELKKRYSLLERNLTAVAQNVSMLTIEVDRIRNVLANKEGFEDLSSPVQLQPHQHTQQQQQQQPQFQQQGQQQQQPQQQMRRGPMAGRSIKVINN